MGEGADGLVGGEMWVGGRTTEESSAVARGAGLGWLRSLGMRIRRTAIDSMRPFQSRYD